MNINNFIDNFLNMVNMIFNDSDFIGIKNIISNLSSYLALLIFVDPIRRIINKILIYTRSFIVIENDKQNIAKFHPYIYYFIFIGLSFALNIFVVLLYGSFLVFYNFILLYINIYTINILLFKIIIIIFLLSLPLILIMLLNVFIIKILKKRNFYIELLQINKYTNFIFGFMNYIFILITVLSYLVFKSNLLFNVLYDIWIFLLICICLLPTIRKFKKTTLVKIYSIDIGPINVKSPIRQLNNMIYYIDQNNKNELYKKKILRLEYDKNISKLYNWNKGNGTIDLDNNNLDFTYYKTLNKDWIKTAKYDITNKNYIINIINVDYINNIKFTVRKSKFRIVCNNIYKKIFG